MEEKVIVHGTSDRCVHQEDKEEQRLIALLMTEAQFR